MHSSVYAYILFLQQANKRRRTSSAGGNDVNDDNGDNDESRIVVFVNVNLQADAYLLN